MTSKLILGTAQFGSDYGISNKRGQIPKNEVFEILRYAKANRINFLDTAKNYGKSETIIGEFIKAEKPRFKIISKTAAEKDNNIKKDLYDSLDKLDKENLYGYLIHNFGYFLKNVKIWKTLQSLKTKRLINKIGFSLYYPKELEYLFNNKIKFDLIELPYNVFDQRFYPYFSQLKKRKIKIYVRSVFLQGLVFKKPDKLNFQFQKIKNKLIVLNKIALKSDIPVAALCLNFVFLNKNIDKIIIGINNLSNLKENIKSLRYKNRVKKISSQLYSLKENDEKIILPPNWV